ncbi:DinB family protein [Aestuariimicrobium sp. T2.26MG-19.2B]|uniref:DinB family protein n=1 Tax=Aestuariimicrobium sp. T2.26MG-19.2B TaxID=3040679 RepID=UPI00253F759D|nr:DinB family protein [Aestuariimicrobium sp. T2.26MG-19.2B]
MEARGIDRSDHDRGRSDRGGSDRGGSDRGGSHRSDLDDEDRRESIEAELRRVDEDFRHLLTTASRSELLSRSDGTRWTNEQLLFHMLFGYLLVRNLLGLVRGFSRLPRWTSRAFATVLNSLWRPFHVVNYWGSLGGARVLGHARMERLFDTTTAELARRLHAATADELARGMHFPTRWDPYFVDYMTLHAVLHYPTQHYDHHRRQLTLSAVRGPGADRSR